MFGLDKSEVDAAARLERYRPPEVEKPWNPHGEAVHLMEQIVYWCHENPAVVLGQGITLGDDGDGFRYVRRSKDGLLLWGRKDPEKDWPRLKMKIPAGNGGDVLEVPVRGQIDDPEFSGPRVLEPLRRLSVDLGMTGK